MEQAGMDISRKAVLRIDDQLSFIAPDQPSPEITDWDERAYAEITSTDLSPVQIGAVVNPINIHPRQKEVLAVHWHPEYIPLELAEERLHKVFPNAERELVIPTQHNIAMALGAFAGVEMDCYAPEFDQKIQLLIHAESTRLMRAERMQSMLAHTFKYRSTQLYQYLETIVDPSKEDMLQKAALQTGAGRSLVQFVRVYAAKLRELIIRHERDTPPFMLRNKLVESYFRKLRELHDGKLIKRALVFLKGVKSLVKAGFSNRYFFQVQEVLEEARAVGARIVVPHPEQFWPVLLAGYDVDGYEVWNPQSRRYTEMLIDYVMRQNEGRSVDERMLVFMGDDTHMSEKALDLRYQDPEKAGREVGYQPAWDDPAIKAKMRAFGLERAALIEEYESRLRG